MTSEENVDASIIVNMHLMCSDGKPIASICEYIWQSLCLENGNSFSVVRYFWKGFGLTLPDARLIEASPICGGKAITIEFLEQRLRPKMEAYVSRQRASEM